MKRLQIYTLIFSIAFLAFFFAPPFISKQLGFYPLMKIGDLIDMFTPLVLIPLYWLLFRISEENKPTLKETLLDETSERRGLFEQHLLKKMINEHIEGRKDWSNRLWAFLFLELWFREYID